VGTKLAHHWPELPGFIVLFYLLYQFNSTLRTDFSILLITSKEAFLMISCMLYSLDICCFYPFHRWMSQSPSGNFTHSLAIQNVYWFNEIFFMSCTNPLLTRIARALSYYQIAWLKKWLMKRIESNGLSFARWHITLPKNIWIWYLLLIVFVQYTSD
jgi:hypothetical protein